MKTTTEIIDAIQDATPLRWETPEHVVRQVMLDTTLGNKTIDTICDIWGLSYGHASKLVEIVKEDRRANGSAGCGNSAKSAKDARADRILNIRNSNGRATPRRW